MVNDKTGIQWTDATWGPVTGCSKVSSGCQNCYAHQQFNRVYGRQVINDKTGDMVPPSLVGRAENGDLISSVNLTRLSDDFRPRKFTDVICHPDRLDKPLHWRKPRRVFVNSMSDLFHDDVPDAFLDQVFAVMALAPRHTFQVLTKRPERMRDYLSIGLSDLSRRINEASRLFGRGVVLPNQSDGMVPGSWPLPNVWLGVSAEDQATADERIPILLDTPAAVRFVSAEPLLGPIRFSSRPWMTTGEGRRAWTLMRDYLTGFKATSQVGGVDGPGLDWVIAGGESGPKARPCDVAWIRSIVKQCKTAKVSVFVKQLGALITTDLMIDIRPFLDRKGGDPAEWPEDLRVREYPEAVTR